MLNADSYTYTLRKTHRFLNILYRTVTHCASKWRKIFATRPDYTTGKVGTCLGGSRGLRSFNRLGLHGPLWHDLQSGEWSRSQTSEYPAVWVLASSRSLPQKGVVTESVKSLCGRLRRRACNRSIRWLYIEPSRPATRFRPVNISCRLCYLKRVLLTCRFVRLYTIMNLLLEAFKIYLKSSLSTWSVCDTMSPKSRSRSLILGAESA